jgi:hypothetical protein
MASLDIETGSFVYKAKEGQYVRIRIKGVLIVFLSYDGSNDLQPVDFIILSSIQLTDRY